MILPENKIQISFIFSAPDEKKKRKDKLAKSVPGCAVTNFTAATPEERFVTTCVS